MGETRTLPVAGLLCAYRFAADGSATDLGPNVDLLNLLDMESEGWLWLHFSLLDERAKRLIASLPVLAAPARETLQSSDKRLAALVEDGTIHGILCDLRRDVFGTTETFGMLHFALSERLIITTRRTPLHSVEAVRERIDKGLKLPLPIDLFEAIVKELGETISTMAEAIVTEIDTIEDRVLEQRFENHRERLVPLRRLLVQLHRHLSALRRILYRVEKVSSEQLPARTHATVEGLIQYLDAIDSDIVNLQDRVRLIFDEIISRTNSDTNQKLNLISILTALFMPATLVAGMFGMNTKDLPFTQTDYGSIYAIFLCAISSALIFFLLKRLSVVGK